MVLQPGKLVGRDGQPAPDGRLKIRQGRPGLGQLVQVKVTASRNAAELKLLNITKRLKDLLVVTRLATVFDSFESEAEGLSSFK